MPRLSVILLLLIVGGIGAGAIFLATWDIPAPTQTVEQVLPDSRFEQ